MINVTESAQQELNTYFEGKDKTPLRIHMADGGCSGMRLTMALDELKDGDKSIESGGFTFLIQPDLAKETGEVTIDMTQYGFSIDSENQIAGTGGGGCGSCGGGCG